MRTSRATGAQKVRSAHALAYRGGRRIGAGGAKRDVLQWTEPKTGVNARGKDKWRWAARVEAVASSYRVSSFSDSRTRAFLWDLLRPRAQTWTSLPSDHDREDESRVPIFSKDKQRLIRH